MQIFVKCQGAHVVEIAAETTVEAIKAFVEAQEGVSASEQYVTFGGRPIEGSLLEAGVSELSTVEVGVRMLGGKVHGSLARAGKVRGQTPKVEKQEKKKEKRGRAKRRAQYNKTFVNVVVGPGKKKGPNTQNVA